MKSRFTLEEVSQMLDLKPHQVRNEITTGSLGSEYHNEELVVTLYDLEKYMGPEHAMMVAREFEGATEEVTG